MLIKITQPIPTNIITGFLGVGKTTTILHLMQSKPSNERWAILVNEFGEVGIDGDLIAANKGQGDDIFIREVPGGCMCCTASLPMQVALNNLLKIAKADRLLIEPTGLGHPQEIIEVLKQPNFASIIDLNATITLVDPRKFSDARYTEHDIFQQQIEVADTLVANKSDQCNEQDFAVLDQYLVDKQHSDQQIHRVSYGEIPLSLLSINSKHNSQATNKPSLALNNQAANSSDDELPELATLKAGEHLKIVNQSEGFTSVGWRFHDSVVFNYQQLYAFLSGLTLQRLKGYFITDKGIFSYNLSDQSLTELPIEEATESRVEYIDDQVLDHNDFEQQLLACGNK